MWIEQGQKTYLLSAELAEGDCVAKHVAFLSALSGL